MTRRRFGSISGSALASIAFGACGVETFPGDPGAGRITSRPASGAPTDASGSRELGLGDPRDALLALPTPRPSGALPLLVLLHGAGGSGHGIADRLGATANAAGVAVLAPDSRGSTWDAIRGAFGRDVAFLNRALERTFETVAIDPERIGVGGFSDGATYALSLGLINGDLFRKIVAFSPGFLINGVANGKPRVFVSHGREDNVLPIDRCSRVIVPGLRSRGYEVTFREFDGGHDMPEAIQAEAMTWIASRS